MSCPEGTFSLCKLKWFACGYNLRVRYRRKWDCVCDMCLDKVRCFMISLCDPRLRLRQLEFPFLIRWTSKNLAALPKKQTMTPKKLSCFFFFSVFFPTKTVWKPSRHAPMRNRNSSCRSLSCHTYSQPQLPTVPLAMSATPLVIIAGQKQSALCNESIATTNCGVLQKSYSSDWTCTI